MLSEIRNLQCFGVAKAAQRRTGQVETVIYSSWSLPAPPGHRFPSSVWLLGACAGALNICKHCQEWCLQANPSKTRGFRSRRVGHYNNYKGSGFREAAKRHRTLRKDCKLQCFRRGLLVAPFVTSSWPCLWPRRGPVVARLPKQDFQVSSAAPKKPFLQRNGYVK